MSNNKFTNYFVFGRETGEFLPPPICGKNEEPVPYLCEGTYGATYWAILPKGSNAKEAFEIYDKEGHYQALRWVGWHLVRRQSRPQNSLFIEGGDTEEWLKRL